MSQLRIRTVSGLIFFVLLTHYRWLQQFEERKLPFLGRLSSVRLAARGPHDIGANEHRRLR